jgi:ketosteroid isomerase-like protein
MSQENVEAERQTFERFARGDFSGLADLPDDFEVVTAREMPDAGTYRGEAAREWSTGWVDSFESLTLEPVEIRDTGDSVMVEFIQRGTPKGGSAPVELRTWSVSTRCDGVLKRWELFQSRAAALEAAGLTE